MNLKKIRVLVFFIIIYASVTCTAYCENKISNVPAPVDYFTGRLNILAMIDEVFTTRSTIVSLIGITGIGKSQIVRKYVETRGEQYSIIWQFDCDKDLLRQLDALVKQVNNKICNQSKNCKISEEPHKLKESLFEFLSNYNDWLLIFDNIKKGENDVLNGNVPQHFFKRNQRIIIVSQDQKALDNIIHIRPFSDAESIDLFKKFHTIYAHDEQLNFIRKLAGYPLAIAKVGSFLRENQYISFRDYEILNDDHRGETKKNEADGFESIRFLLHNDIIRINKRAYELLVYAAFLDNNNIIEDILFEICKSGYSRLDRAEFLSNIITLTRYLLIEYKRNPQMINDFKEFEMHGFIQEALKEGLTQPEKQKYLEDIVRKLNKFLPNSYTALCEMYDKYPTLINTLEVLVKEIESVEIPSIEVMNFKNRLLMLYLYILDYEKAKQLIDLFDNAINSKEVEFNTAEEKSIYATYLLYKGTQYDLIHEKNDIARDSVKKALEVMKGCESQYPNLLYALNQELADIYVYNGDLAAAAECVSAAESIANNYQDISELEQSLLFFVKTKIALYNGFYEQALDFINQDIEASKNLKSAVFKAPSIQMKGYILLKLRKVEEAMQLLSNFLNDLQSEVGDKHLMNSLILTVMSEAALMKEDIENAEKYADQSIEILMNILSERSKGINDSDFITFAYSYSLKGDVEYSKVHYKKALDYYFKALKIYEKRYGKNMKLDHVSELYYRIVKAAKQLKHSQLVQKYVHAHDNIFGLKHRRTQELYDLLVHSQLDGSV